MTNPRATPTAPQAIDETRPRRSGIRRMLSRLAAPIAVAVALTVSAWVVVPSTAQAGDTYYPCQAMVSTVSPGATHYQQSISCVARPACGETWGQVYTVDWYMSVASGGITVRYIVLKVTHTRGEDITIGAKSVIGANRTYDLGAWNHVPPSSTTWSKTYDVSPDTYFAKRSDGTIEFQFFQTSDKANGCAVGWTQLRYQLKVV